MRSIRRAEPRPKKGPKLYVQPAELARKLVKEMEDHKVSRSTHVSVCNRYLIFLCPEDYDRFIDQEEQLLAKLEYHLFKRVRAKGYEVPGDIVVEMTVDPDLKLGHFGILAEHQAEDWVEVEQAVPVTTERWSSVGPEPRLVDSANAAIAEPVPVGRSKIPGTGSVSGATAMITADEAAELALARQVIVVKAGNRVREYSKGRIIVGRARDVDFRVDNPNVSRRHAAIYWSEGNTVVEDLGSTNGTMVNGLPVSNSVVHPGDVVHIGDCRFTVETR